MFSRLLNFIKGYVVISAAGFSTERFINLAARRGIFLWNARRDEGRLTASVSVKGFRELRQCAKKSGCRLRIVRKTGLPFVLHRYKKRKFLVLGMILFVIIAAYLTSFVWLVTVRGTVDMDPEILAAKLAALGVAPGESKEGINARDIERELMASFPELAFANLDVTGTRAVLRVVEGIRPPEREDSVTASDIVAAKDGVIVSIATEIGRPLVKPGDVVRAGDVLVSGEVIVGDFEYGFSSYFVRAGSEVLAKRYYEYVLDIPLTYEIKSFTGNVRRSYGIILFDKKIYFDSPGNPFSHWEMTSKESRLSFGRDYPLPAVWFEEIHREFEPVTVSRSPEEAEIMGRTIVDARLLRELPEGTEIVSVDYDYAVSDGVMTVYAYAAVIENIGMTREIIMTTR